MKSGACYILLTIAVSVVPSASALATAHPNTQFLIRRNIASGPNLSLFKGSGIAASPSVHTNATADQPIPFSCEINVDEANYEVTYSDSFPNMLQFINWVGDGTATCTEAMSSISFTIWATNPQGTQNIIASGECIDCAENKALTTNYFCQQPQFSGKCGGDWQVSYQTIITAPTRGEFISGTGGCVVEGPILTCGSSADVGNIPPYEFIIMPDGYQDDIELDQLAIDDIKDFHYEGGSEQDDSKGLFFPWVTNDDLQNIFMTGLEDSSAEWSQSTTGNYKKTFYFSGVGITSPGSGGQPSTQIDLFITPAGGQVNTMYPS